MRDTRSKKRIAFLELSHVFANQIKLPYSTGCLWSYCRQNPTISSNFSFDVQDWYYILDDKLDVDDVVNQLSKCDILGVSYFVWNTVMSDTICEKVKQQNPNILIVYGGLGTPKWGRCDEFIRERPFIDVIVHNEGELVFENILVSLQNGQTFESIKGITTKSFTNELEPRIKNINDLPSPYLDGLFDDLVKSSNHDYVFEALIEPERGCPYTCSFCELGDRFFTKIVKQPMDKVYSEIDWISSHKIDYMHVIDNNFGMFPQHEELTEYIIKKRDATGYPNALNITWAKNKKPFLFRIAKKMNDAGLLKGLTVALQSMNPKTLKAINRDNLDLHNLKDIVNLMKEMKIPAFMEFILGLPEETLDSFKKGLYDLMDDIQYHNYVGINNMIALPNTPFGDKKYLTEHGIKLVKTSPAFYHHQHPKEKLLKDSNNLIASTNTLSFDEYIEANLWKWYLTSTHMLGWTRVISIDLNKNFLLSFKSFYDNLFEFFINDETSLLYREYNITKELLYKVFDGTMPWGRVVSEVSNLYWPYEEATALIFAQNKRRFYDEISAYIFKEYDNFDDPKYIQELLQKQSNKMKDPYKMYDGNLEKWCKECMWWGSRSERFFVGESL